MEITGKLIVIEETQTFGSNGFKKRNVVVETTEQYPQKIQVEFVQAKTDLLDKFNKGDEVTISINLRGREWTNPEGEIKYFNSIQGWKIVKKGNQSSPPAQQSTGNKQDDDDLPF